MGRQWKCDRIQYVLLGNSYIREQNSVSGAQTSHITLVRMWCAFGRRRAGSGSKHKRTPKHVADSAGQPWRHPQDWYGLCMALYRVVVWTSRRFLEALTGVSSSRLWDHKVAVDILYSQALPADGCYHFVIYIQYIFASGGNEIEVHPVYFENQKH